MIDGSKSFDFIKARLDEIVEAVGDSEIPLESALDLYEEAIALGTQAASLLEQGVLEDDQAEQDKVS